MRLRELAERLGVPFEGEGDAEISGCAPIEEAGERDLTFVANPRYARALRESRAGAVIVGPDAGVHGRNALRAANPQAAFARALAWFDKRPRPAPGVHTTAVVAASAAIGAYGAYSASKNARQDREQVSEENELDRRYRAAVEEIRPNAVSA